MTVTTNEETVLETTGAEVAPIPSAAVATPAADALVEADLLVEDVSIDGMCGVY
jgi:mycofactocin precursor